MPVNWQKIQKKFSSNRTLDSMAGAHAPVDGRPQELGLIRQMTITCTRSSDSAFTVGASFSFLTSQPILRRHHSTALTPAN